MQGSPVATDPLFGVCSLFLLIFVIVTVTWLALRNLSYGILALVLLWEFHRSHISSLIGEEILSLLKDQQAEEASEDEGEHDRDHQCEVVHYLGLDGIFEKKLRYHYSLLSELHDVVFQHDM